MRPCRNTVRAGTLVGFVVVACCATSVRAQNFLPPEVDSERSNFSLALDGFGVRIGGEVNGETQAVAGLTMDMGNLGSERLRLRPSAEIGFASENDSYVVGTEAIYRFTADDQDAVPYVGVGVAMFGAEDCSARSDCPRLWPQFTIGFEIRARGSVNWLIEYRAEDTFGRHRIFVGLATRRGG